MLKAFINFLSFSLSDLMDAIEQGDTDWALTQIKRANSVNMRRNIHDLTPLQASLLKKNFRVTAALLDKGADPNAPFLFSEDLGSTFSIQVASDDLNTIKLMLLHGAELNDRDWQIASPFAKEIIKSVLPLQTEILNLKNNAKSHHQKITNYRRLQEIWQNCAQNESNPIYQQYYQQKASSVLNEYIEQDTAIYKRIRKQKSA